MPTYTTTYSLGKPVVGADEDAWGDTLNTSLDAIDDILDGTTPVTGIDINSGTLDGVTIGGTTAGAGTFTTLTANTSITGTLATAAQPNVTSLGTLTSLTVSGDISFGDNDKAIFGAGSDLQIYHSGTHSIINDGGTGDLLVQANTFKLQNAAGTATALDYDPATGALQLYKSNAVKLATTSTGIDVTGTVTVDGLTVQNNSAATAQIAIENTGAANSTDYKIVAGRVGTNNNGFSIYDSANATTAYYLKDDGSQQFYGDISFYEDTGTTAKFFWDASAESLGIGTTSPSQKLSVDSGNIQLSNNYQLRYGTNTQIQGADTYINFNVNNVNPAIRIDSSGNVGIGVVPENWLSTYTALQIRSAASVIGSTDNSFVGIGANAYLDSADTRYEYINSDYATQYYQVDGTHVWRYAPSGTADAAITWSEAMRIDSSGNLLVGRTSTAFSGTGHIVQSNGIVYHMVDGAAVQYLRRNTSDGDILRLYKDTTQVGSIGTKGGDLTIGTGDTSIRFEDGADHIIPFRVDTNVGRDAAVNLGDNLTRFKDLYLSGGVFLGGTGSSNKLDDYEEGVTTVTMTAGSGTITLGNDKLHYTKIGNVVHVNGQLSVNSVSSPSGSLSINLPFTCLSGSGDSRSEGVCIIDSPSTLNAGDFNIQVTEGNSTGTIFRTNASTMTSDATEIDTFCFIKISMTYKTT